MSAADNKKDVREYLWDIHTDESSYAYRVPINLDGNLEVVEGVDLNESLAEDINYSRMHEGNRKNDVHDQKSSDREGYNDPNGKLFRPVYDLTKGPVIMTMEAHVNMSSAEDVNLVDEKNDVHVQKSSDRKGSNDPNGKLFKPVYDLTKGPVIMSMEVHKTLADEDELIDKQDAGRQ